MVDLPYYPFKTTEYDETHPLVREALRSRKHYEKCWCGSDRKFKNCHRLREQEPEIQLGRILDEQSRIFWRQRGCMHPNAGPEQCKGKIIDSHSIQRKGPLGKIVDTKNHVCHLNIAAGGVSLRQIGWRKASVFPGYCSQHDSDIFSPLEKEPFHGTHEQCVLQRIQECM